MAASGGCSRVAVLGFLAAVAALVAVHSLSCSAPGENVLDQGSNLGLLHGRWILYPLNYLGSPYLCHPTQLFFRLFSEDSLRTYNVLGIAGTGNLAVVVWQFEIWMMLFQHGGTKKI